MIADVPHDHPLLVQFREDPYPLYQFLLAQAPVQWNPVLDAWTFARYADVVSTLTDARFSVDRARAEIDVRGARSMLVSDPPDHTRLRALVQKAFTPRMVDQLRPRILAIVGELLDRMAERSGVVDLVADLAYPLPVVVIAELLGVPPKIGSSSTHGRRYWPPAWIRWCRRAHRQPRRAGPRGLHAYLRDVIAQRRREPRADLISALVAVEERGDVLSEPSWCSCARCC